jgi:hypothetical protein
VEGAVGDKLCFVIGPIGEVGTEKRRHADWLLKGIIKPVFKAHFQDFNVERADEIVAPGSINAQVINRLFDAPLVIADMSLENANAFYELAIRHMKRLPTIHMIQAGEEIPFDVAPYRAVKFSYADPNEIEKAQAELKSTVEEVIKPGFVIENPITHARGIIELQEHATAPERVFIERLEAIESRIANLEGPASKSRRELQQLRNYIAHTRSITLPDSLLSQWKGNEPTMEDILAAIRRLIDEEKNGKVKPK